MQAAELWTEFGSKTADYLKKRGVEQPWDPVEPGGLGVYEDVKDYGSGETIGMSRLRNGDGVPFVQNYYGFKENLRAQYADRAWQIRKAYLDENPNRQSLLALKISRISPATVYYNATAILAETDLGNYRQFMEQARQYRREWVEYLQDEKIFSSRRWFTEQNSEEPLDLTGIPRFQEQGENISSSLQRAVFDIMILAVLNMLCFMGAFLSFLRYET